MTRKAKLLEDIISELQWHWDHPHRPSAPDDVRGSWVALRMIAIKALTQAAKAAQKGTR